MSPSKCLSQSLSPSLKISLPLKISHPLKISLQIALSLSKPLTLSELHISLPVLIALLQTLCNILCPYIVLPKTAHST